MPVLIRECRLGNATLELWLSSRAAFPSWVWSSTELREQSIPTWELTFLCKATRAGAAAWELSSPLSCAGTSDALGFTVPDPNFHSPGASPACSPSAAYC